MQLLYLLCMMVFVTTTSVVVSLKNYQFHNRLKRTSLTLEFRLQTQFKAQRLGFLPNLSPKPLSKQLQPSNQTLNITNTIASILLIRKCVLSSDLM